MCVHKYYFSSNIIRYRQIDTNTQWYTYIYIFNINYVYKKDETNYVEEDLLIYIIIYGMVLLFSIWEKYIYINQVENGILWVCSGDGNTLFYM